MQWGKGREQGTHAVKGSQVRLEPKLLHLSRKANSHCSGWWLNSVCERKEIKSDLTPSLYEHVCPTACRFQTHYSHCSNQQRLLYILALCHHCNDFHVSKGWIGPVFPPYIPVRSLLFYQIEAIKMPPRNPCWGSALAANGPMVGIVALSITQPHLFDHMSFKWASGLSSKILI